MVARRASLLAAGAALCAALALWVSFGALSFVDAENDAPYVGVLPPVSWLVVLLVAAIALTMVIRPSPRAVSPLWLSAVVLLPWLPLPVPLSAFIWTGNLLLWLWAAIGVALAAPAVSRLVRSQRVLEMPPRRAALFAGFIAAAAYGLAAWSTSPAHPNGDEPHYLIITQSLLLDRDLKIENNHRRADYASYLGRSLAAPHFMRRGKNGEIYSLHAPGLSAIVAPAFALFGYRGVLLELVVIASAASALAWLIAWRVTADAAASWFAWAAVALSVPFFFHATAIFPDGLGAVLTLAALLPLVDRRAREPRWLAAIGAALAVLPWLHSRFAILAASAAVVIAGRVMSEDTRRAQRLVCFAVCPAISAAAWLLFFQTIYGTPNPSVTYEVANSMAAGNIVRGAPGLLTDQQYGLIPNAPVYLCALAGIVVMLRRGPKRLAAELLLIAVPYVLVLTFFYQWWAGTTPPARFLVPVTLILAVPAAVWYVTVRSVAARIAGITALLFSLLMTTTMAAVGRGGLVFNDRDGVSRVAAWLSPVVDLPRALPSLFQNPPRTVVLQAGVWLLAIASAVAVGALFNRRGREAVVVAFGLTLQIAAMAAVSIVWRSNAATVATPSASGPPVLRRWHSGDRIALAYRPFHRLDSTALPGAIVLARTLSTVPRPERVGLAHLPAGVYELRGRTIGAATGRVRVKTDRVSGPIADWDVASLEANWVRQVSIPVAVSGLQIEVDPSARKAVRDVSIRAVSLQPANETPEGREARRAARYGPSTVFLLAGDAWVEPGGTWIAGRSNAEFAIATDPQAPLQLLVRNGPIENSVTLASAAWREQLRLTAGEERLVNVPSGARARTTPLTIAAANGFRPADVDPGSEDRRLLGVWIETR
jgi:hypothetical protein